MGTILWIIAAVLVIAGIVQIVQGELILGIVLIVVGLLVGPGGVSLFAAGGPALSAAWPLRLSHTRVDGNDGGDAGPRGRPLALR
jgi:hypothetical protein